MSAVVTYKEIRDFAVARLARAFASRKDIVVETHPGRFDEEEIRRLCQRTPAILTSLMSIKNRSVDDNQNLEFVTWVLVRADNQDRLFDTALQLLSIIVPLLKGIDAEWSHGGAQDIDATNLYTSRSGAINVALWAVSWTWPLRGSVLIPWAKPDEVAGGGILMPLSLEIFEGYDAALRVGTQAANDHTDV